MKNWEPQTLPEIARAIAIEFIIVLRVEKVSREAEVDCTIEGPPQQREPITLGPYPTQSTFHVGGDRITRRKSTTFGRALTYILFSYEDWVRVSSRGSS